MKEQPLFAPGQKVICVDVEPSKYTTPNAIRCVLGEEYTIDNPDAKGQISTDGHITVTLREIPRTRHLQYRFVPVDFDRYAEETFHQSLKGKPVNV